MASTASPKKIFANIAWDEDIEYRLDEFVDHFILPQLVKVLEGYHGVQEESVISIDQVLMLHAVRTVDKALVRDRQNTELRIPLNCGQKVDLCPEMAATNTELSESQFVRATSNLGGNTAVFKGDKLQVLRVLRDKKGRESSIVLKNPRLGKKSISLPLNAETAGKLQPLLDGREYFLKELSMMKLPVSFQFIDAPERADVLRDQSVFSSSLGVLKLEKIYPDTLVICSTKETVDTKTVFTCPKTLPIIVVGAKGAFDGDKDYVTLCSASHHDVSLSMIEDMESENIYASPDSIREYRYIDAAMTPNVPPRIPEQTASRERSTVEPRLLKPSPPEKSASLQVNRSHSAENVYEDPELVTRSLRSPPRSPGSNDVELAAETRTDSNSSDQISRMSVKEVCDFLKSWNLEDFVDVFHTNHVDGAILATLEAEDMADLGMNCFQRKKLLKLISGWRPKTE